MQEKKADQDFPESVIRLINQPEKWLMQNRIWEICKGKSPGGLKVVNIKDKGKKNFCFSSKI